MSVFTHVHKPKVFSSVIIYVQYCLLDYLPQEMTTEEVDNAVSPFSRKKFSRKQLLDAYCVCKFNAVSLVRVLQYNSKVSIRLSMQYKSCTSDLKPITYT
jgi:hypothetical protein